ncbi:hypothetical protein RB213_001825 [Colletotrichum asianum]
MIRRPAGQIIKHSRQLETRLSLALSADLAAIQQPSYSFHRHKHRPSSRLLLFSSIQPPSNL